MAANLWRRQPSGKLKASMLYANANGLTTQIIAEGYFEVPTVLYGAILKVWNGSAWVKKILKRWNGSAWVPAVMKVYKAGSFQLVDTTGV